MAELRLCAIIHVRDASRVRGVTPATWVIREADLERAVLHPDDPGLAHATVPQAGYIRVCVPLTMVQESLDLGV